MLKELEGSTYIGDAVYMKFDGYYIWLMTTDGISITNQIALEPQMLDTIKEVFGKYENRVEESN